MRSQPSGSPRGALAFVLLVVCLQGLPYDPLGLSLVVRRDLASYSLCAAASPSPRGPISFPASPIGSAAVNPFHNP